MMLKSLPRLLLLLGLSLSLPVMADSNLVGDEIIILDDTNLSLSPTLDPAFAEPLLDDPNMAETATVGDVWQRIKQGYALPQQTSP